MKKHFIILSLLVVMVTGCGEKKDERTIDDFVKAFETSGIEVALKEKPLFQMIGADDGILFYIENDVVKIYEYDELKNLKEAQETFVSTVQDMPVNGRFMLDTNSAEAIEIFNNVQ